MTTIRLSARARAYLQAEQTYLSGFDKRAARAVLHQIKKAIRLIGDHPKAGVVVDAAAGIRRYTSPPYQIDYIIIDTVVTVAAIRHGRQNPREVDDDAGDPGTDD